MSSTITGMGGEGGEGEDISPNGAKTRLFSPLISVNHVRFLFKIGNSV